MESVWHYKIALKSGLGAAAVGGEKLFILN